MSQPTDEQLAVWRKACSDGTQNSADATIVALIDALAEVRAERDQARNAILDFGANPAGFDWEVLGKIDEQEREIERLRADVAKLRTAMKGATEADPYGGDWDLWMPQIYAALKETESTEPTP